MGLQPVWIIPHGLFAISVDGQEKYINFARSPLNSHSSVSLAENKYLTRLILERQGLENIPFLQPHTLTEAESFLQTHGKIIAKPVKGSGARDIHIIIAADQLQDLEISGYILEKYTTGKEWRYLVLNGEVIGVHRSEYGESVEENRPLRRISYARSTWDEALTASSLQIARTLDLNFAAVDYLIDTTGHAYILEVNTAPGLKWFHAPTSGPVTDVARLFLEALYQDKKSTNIGTQPVLAYS